MSQGRGKKTGRGTRSPDKSTSLTEIDNMDSNKLCEISNTLSDILSVLRDLTKVIKDSPIMNKGADVVPVSTLNDISQTLSNISKSCTNQQTPNPIDIASSSFAETEALKVKGQIANIWDAKIERRKDAYWNYVKNKGHKETYAKWLNGERIVIPKYLQRKLFNNEHPDQRKLREAAVLHDFKTEIDLQELRSTQQMEKVKKIDKDMETLFKQKCSGPAEIILLEMWKAQATQNENISHRRWLKNEAWLKNYEDTFQRTHSETSPFFKIQTEQPTTYAEVTAKPKRKVPVSRQTQERGSLQAKQQNQLETIQTLLQQVQAQYNNQERNRNGVRPRRQSRQRNNALSGPITVNSDNEDNFLEDSTSTETLT